MSDLAFILWMLTLLFAGLFALGAPTMWRMSKKLRITEFFTYRSGHGRHSLSAATLRFAY